MYSCVYLALWYYIGFSNFHQTSTLCQCGQTITDIVKINHVCKIAFARKTQELAEAILFTAERINVFSNLTSEKLRSADADVTGIAGNSLKHRPVNENNVCVFDFK